MASTSVLTSLNFVPGTAQSLIDVVSSALANTTFNINNFKATLDNHNSIQKPNLFNVLITMPSLLQPVYGYNSDAQDISMFCMATQLPAPAQDSVPIFRYGYGPAEQMPFNIIFTPITLLFIGDGESYIINFFRAWQRSIQEHSSEGLVNFPPVIGPNRTSPSMMPYMLNYKDDYSTQVTIQLFDPTTALVDQVVLREAYPIDIQNIELSWEMQHQFMTIAVTLSYMDISYNAKTVPTDVGTLATSSLGYDLFGAAASIINNTATSLIPLIK